MLRTSVSDPSSIDLHRYLSLGQVSGFEDECNAPLPPPVPSRLSTKAQLNLRPADLPISHGGGSKAMLRAHAADARYWRPQTTGAARSSKSRPADVLRGNGSSPHRVGDAASEQDRPRSSNAASYMDDAAILAAIKQDKVLWKRVHSPSPTALLEDKAKRSATSATNRHPPRSQSLHSNGPSSRPALQNSSSKVDVSVSDSPPHISPNGFTKSSSLLLSPSPSASRRLISPSSAGPAVLNSHRNSPQPSARTHQPISHADPASPFSHDQKQPSLQQHELDRPFVQHQAAKVLRSPLLSALALGAKTPPSSKGLSSPSKFKPSPQPVPSIQPLSVETRDSSGTNSPGTTSAGLQRLMLEYARALFLSQCAEYVDHLNRYELCKQMDAVAVASENGNDRQVVVR